MRPLSAALLSATIPPDVADRFDADCERWLRSGSSARLIARDATLWTNHDESQWLGWLDAPSAHLGEIPRLSEFAAEVAARGYTHVLLLGMGGSSMCPEVLMEIFRRRPGFPTLLVLDSTDPAQIRTFERRIDLARSLVVVASKSGTTLEPNLLAHYFLERMRAVRGDQAGRSFVAITDPGSNLEVLARREGFWRVFHGVPSIGGRYAALSNFGLVPAALLGMDLRRWLDRAMAARAACEAADPSANPGVALGLLLGMLTATGRDKLTLVCDAALVPFGAWVEQLVGESLGKHAQGLIPVIGEPLDARTVYGADRLFVRLCLAGESDPNQTETLAALAVLGHPVITINLQDRYELAREFLRWSVAVAVAGTKLGVNPFNQPDVEAPKVTARKLADEYEVSGDWVDPPAVARDLMLKVFGQVSVASRAPVDALRALIASIGVGDYFSLLAFIEMNAANNVALEAIRTKVAQAKRVASTIGYGPRYLHSTGQLHKGGPASGVFLLITCDEANDLPIPGRKATFGVIKRAQARGDFAVLDELGRRVLRVHLSGDIAASLAVLSQTMEQALGGR